MQAWLAYVFQDWGANSHDAKIRLSLFLFRMAQKFAKAPRPLQPLVVPYLAFYRILVVWIFGMDLHWNARIGPALRIFHGTALVVHPDSAIGSNCTLRHATTLGDTRGRPGLPTLGDGVNVGSNVVILGPVHVGEKAVIGAGSVVVKDVPAGSVVAGNPATVLRPADARIPPPTG